MLATESIILLTCVLYVSLNSFMYHFKKFKCRSCIAYNTVLFCDNLLWLSFPAIFYKCSYMFFLYLTVSHRPLAAENQSVCCILLYFSHMYSLICDTIINNFLSYLILVYGGIRRPSVVCQHFQTTTPLKP